MRHRWYYNWYYITWLQLSDRCVGCPSLSKDYADLWEMILSWRRRHFPHEKRNRRRLSSQVAPNVVNGAPCNHLRRSFQSSILRMLLDSTTQIITKKKKEKEKMVNYWKHGNTPGWRPACTQSWTRISFGAEEVSPIRLTGTSIPQNQLFFTPSPESLFCTINDPFNVFMPKRMNESVFRIFRILFLYIFPPRRYSDLKVSIGIHLPA